MAEAKRMKWIDGLRGIACGWIFVHHFLLFFYPATYWGLDATTHTPKAFHWDAMLAQSPFACLINGNFWVCVFLTVSGLVLSNYVFSHSASQVADSMLKRYFRLSLPVFVLSAIVFFMMKWNLFREMAKAAAMTGSPSLLTLYATKASFLEVVLDSFINVWFVGDQTFSGAFWMLSALFIGSYVSYILALIAKERRFLWGYVGIIVILGLLDSLVVCAAVGGLLAYGMKHIGHPGKGLKWISALVGILFLVVGLFLGGYPTGVTPDNVYRLLPKLPPAFTSYQIWHVLGAGAFLLGLSMIPALQSLLETRAFQFFGKISFSFYLVHLPLLCAFSIPLFIWFIELGIAYTLSAFIAFLVSFAMSVLAAWLFWLLVEQNCNRITAMILFVKK